jgi:prepilin-type N-terminal cleavage/methylation domain-containing protein
MFLKKNNKRIKFKTGFTLMELLIYMAVLSIMSVVVSDSFLTLNKGRDNIEIKSELNSNLSFVLEKVKYDISVAEGLNFPAVAGESAAALDLSIGGENIYYSLDQGRLVRQAGVGSPEFISPENLNISNLSFTRLENINPFLGSKKVSLEINISGAYNSGDPGRQYEQSRKAMVNLNADF